MSARLGCSILNASSTVQRCGSASRQPSCQATFATPGFCVNRLDSGQVDRTFAQTSALGALSAGKRVQCGVQRSSGGCTGATAQQQLARGQRTAIEVGIDRVARGQQRTLQRNARKCAAAL